ncbi:MAG: formylglycine-generating enzyme family protein [Symploca sp. SIO1B1]|nr:formylglycine-generating enzyme family protein [Symploca sp. SIO1C2]NER96620.1 formylglycine-generating enzyme family protein [Symploca sp. SIO1B1]
MMHSVNQRPSNTQVILQRLAEIERIINRQKNGLTRRQLIKVAGLSGVSLVGGVIAYQTWKQQQLNLQSFEFDVITVDLQGKKNNPNRRQAKFFTEDLGKVVMLEMVAIPGGTFMRGSPATEEARINTESPQLPVDIKPFYLSKCTITQEQWKAVAALPKVSRDLNTDPSYFKGDNLPVEQVSWHSVKEFCDRLSNKINKTSKTGRNYRLPSEAEWEYACRAGTTTPFHFGETITTDLVNYDGNSTYGFGSKGEYRQTTTKEKNFRVANAFGLYDMHGNVWEWCDDHWHYSYNGAPNDGSAWLKQGNENDSYYRVLRGGSWSDNPKYCRSAQRNRYNPNYWYKNIGFRVAIS